MNFLKIILFAFFLAQMIPTLHARRVKIKIHDKISMIKHPLMIKTIVAGNAVKFYWSEPHQDFTYFLEIYRQGTAKPIGTMRVEGRSKVVKFQKRKEKIFWRVFAKSKYGNLTSNKRKFLVPLR